MSSSSISLDIGSPFRVWLGRPPKTPPRGRGCLLGLQGLRTHQPRPVDAVVEWAWRDSNPPVCQDALRRYSTRMLNWSPYAADVESLCARTSTAWPWALAARVPPF